MALIDSELKTLQTISRILEDINLGISNTGINAIRLSARYTTTAAVTLSGLGVQGGGDWPGSLTAGDRILVKNQGSGEFNGIYVASETAWTRSTDFDQDAEVTPGALIVVNEGTTLSDILYKLETDAPITVGTTTLTFAKDSTGTLAEVMANGRDVDATGTINTSASVLSIDVNNSQLHIAAQRKVDWASAELVSSANATTLDWENSQLKGNWDVTGNILGIGVASTTDSSIKLYNAINANAITIQTGVTSGSYTLTLPTAQASGTQVLENNGSGVLSWATISSSNIYNSDDTLTANRTVSQSTFTLDFVTGIVDGFSVDGTTFSVDGLNNRVGIGIAAPSATLDVVGTFQYVDTNEGAGKVLTSDASGNATWQTAGADTSIYTDDGSLTGNRIVTQGANTLAFTASAVNAFSVDGTTFSVDASNDRVGVGTASPNTDLQVDAAAGGAVRVTNTANSGQADLQLSGTGGGQLVLYDIAGALKVHIRADGGGSYWTTGSDNENRGAGWLAQSAAGAARANLELRGTGEGQLALYDTTPTLKILLTPTAGVNNFIDGVNLGIGVTTPTAKLEVKGTGTGTGQTFAVHDSTGSSNNIVALDNGKTGFGTASPSRTVSINAAVSSYQSFDIAGTAQVSIGSDAQGRFVLYDQTFGYVIRTDVNGRMSLNTAVGSARFDTLETAASKWAGRFTNNVATGDGFGVASVLSGAGSHVAGATLFEGLSGTGVNAGTRFKVDGKGDVEHGAPDTATAGGTGTLALRSVSASVTCSGGATENININVPSGAKIIACQLRNDDLITATTGVTYSAAYNTGATQSIGTGVAFAKNTKVNTFFDANAATDITTATTDITLTPDAGTLDSGEISAIVWYYDMTSITNAA